LEANFSPNERIGCGGGTEDDTPAVILVLDWFAVDIDNSDAEVTWLSESFDVKLWEVEDSSFDETGLLEVLMLSLLWLSCGRDPDLLSQAAS
jgi:hypothetical protein